MAQITIADATPRVQYTVTGGAPTGPWTIPWPYYAESDIKVYFDSTLQTVTTHYTTSGTAVDDGFSGGTVTAVSSQAAGTIVTLVRDIPIARTTDFPVGPFNVATLNKDLDKLYAICQQLEETNDRLLQLAETTSTSFSSTLPEISGEGGKFLKVNSGETAIEYGNGTTLSYQGAWSASSTYAQNDIVEHNGSSYISLVNSNLNKTPPAPASAPDAFWNLIAQKGDAGAGGVGGPGSSTDNSIVRWSGTDGDTTQNSGVSIDDDDNLFGHGASYNAQTGTSYTLTASDNGKIVTLNNGSAITLTLPQTSTTSLAAGFSCLIIQRGAGQVTVAVQGSDTLESSGSKTKLTGQHSSAFITKNTAGSPNTWGLYGDISS